MKTYSLALSAAALLALPIAGLADPDADGRAAYEAACARCHDVGMMGAPVTDDPAEWADREVSEASLDAHAEKGLLKGGVNDTARAAADYMGAVTATK